MIKKIADMLGYNIDRKKKSPNLKSHLALILKQLDINLVLDVGANTGQFGSFLRSCGYKGDILSFEPTASAFNLLSITAKKDLRWSVINIGLGDMQETKEINIFEASDLNSILSPSELEKKRFKSRMDIKKIELIKLETCDSVLRKMDLYDKRIFLKMDTQGYDLKVFNGCQESLQHILGLVSEIPLQHIYQDGNNYHETLKRYEDNNFKISGIYPVSRNKEDQTIIEVDCVMIK